MTTIYHPLRIHDTLRTAGGVTKRHAEDVVIIDTDDDESGVRSDGVYEKALGGQGFRPGGRVTQGQLKREGGGADGGDAGGCTGRVGNGGGSGFISARTQLAIDLAKKGQAYNAGQHNLSGQVCF